MKNAVLTGALAVSIIAGATLAQAAGDKQGPGPQMKFEEIDANSDGKLSKDEMATHRAARFKAADTDGDGLLSAEEMKAQAMAKMGRRADKRVSKMIKHHDADEDGKLSMDEMKSMKRMSMFERADTDGDGAISKAEFDEAKAMHGKKGKHGKRCKDKGMKDGEDS